MTLKRRIERLEQVRPAFYADVSGMPTQLLEGILRRAYKAGEWPRTPEDETLHGRLEKCGLENEGDPKRTDGTQKNGLR
jgi:hypothetical protein